MGQSIRSWTGDDEYVQKEAGKEGGGCQEAVTEKVRSEEGVAKKVERKVLRLKLDAPSAGSHVMMEGKAG